MAKGRVAEPEGETRADPRDQGSFLIDKSAWEQRHHGSAARDRINDLAAEGRAAICLPVALEQLYSARSKEDFDSRREAFDLLVWLPITAAVEAKALEIMAELATKGQHRLPLPDIMIAATALVHEATVLHDDGHFERLGEAVGLPHKWVVPRGSGHGSPGAP